MSKLPTNILVVMLASLASYLFYQGNNDVNKCPSQLEVWGVGHIILITSLLLMANNLEISDLYYQFMFLLFLTLACWSFFGVYCFQLTRTTAPSCLGIINWFFFLTCFLYFILIFGYILYLFGCFSSIASAMTYQTIDDDQFQDTFIPMSRVEAELNRIRMSAAEQFLRDLQRNLEDLDSTEIREKLANPILTNQNRLETIQLNLLDKKLLRDNCLLNHNPEMRKGEEGLKEAPDCSVCLQEFTEREPVIYFPGCSHKFHLDCIEQWLTKKRECPCCKRGFRENFFEFWIKKRNYNKGLGSSFLTKVD